MPRALVRFVQPWTALAAGLLPLLIMLLVLPSELTVSPPFTILLVATYGAVIARLYLKWAEKEHELRWGWVLPVALPVLLLADLGVAVHLDMPFWVIADKAAFCKGVGQTAPTCQDPRAQAAKSVAEPFPNGRFVHIVEHGWHSGLVIETADLPTAEFPYFAGVKARRIEVGWGDEEFFQTDDPTLFKALDAMVTPGPSVIHLAEFDQAVEDYFVGTPIYKVPMTADGLARLGRYVGQSFRFGADGAPVTTSKGDYGPESRFVQANGEYYFPNTCNVWTARALADAGVPISPALAVTSKALLHQVRQVSSPVRPLQR